MYRQNFDQKKQDLEITHSNLKQAIGTLIEELNSVISEYKQIEKSDYFNSHELWLISQIPYFKSANIADFQETKNGFIFTIQLIPDVNKKYLNYRVFYREIDFETYITKDNTKLDSLQLFNINGNKIYSRFPFRTVNLKDDDSPFLLNKKDINKIINAIILLTKSSLLDKYGMKHRDLAYRRDTFFGYLEGLKEKYFSESNTSLSKFIYDEEL